MYWQTLSVPYRLVEINCHFAVPMKESVISYIMHPHSERQLVPKGQEKLFVEDCFKRVSAMVDGVDRFSDAQKSEANGIFKDLESQALFGLAQSKLPFQLFTPDKKKDFSLSNSEQIEYAMNLAILFSRALSEKPSGFHPLVIENLTVDLKVAVQSHFAALYTRMLELLGKKPPVAALAVLDSDPLPLVAQKK